MHKLVLYSRPECHLCDAVVQRLQPLLANRPVELEIVDVDSSVALERRYGLRIPVLVAGDVEVSGYPLDEARVRQYLESL
ncbi:MAG: glutaredoxin family protein [Gammaproteobacteria bacterium]